ncbi:hypothetical protein [Shewanella maritima]|uniref:hypothetical protein n=1 Tax=Shewanella maritima TaxID=2520507 RepID=UPI003735DA00
MSTTMPVRMSFIFVLYTVLAIITLWRTATFSAYDLLSIAVFPVIIGLWIKAQWARVVWFMFIIIQSIGLIAMSVVALIAYQITPEDVKLTFMGINIPVIPFGFTLLALIIFQWWVALSAVAKKYLQTEQLQ